MIKSTEFPLHKIPKGSRVLIVEVPEGKGKSQLIRLGILKGEFIRCLERLPGGTMVIEKNRTGNCNWNDFSKIDLRCIRRRGNP